MRLTEHEVIAVEHTLKRVLVTRLFDSYTSSILEGELEILVDETSGLIVEVCWGETAAHKFKKEYNVDLERVEVIDLRACQLVLPGFVDTHVHLFLHPYTETSWDEQVTRESTTERIVRAVAHARSTIEAGFTTVRDLGTEGAGDSDVGLRKAISAPLELVPGPRYFIANRGTVSTGSYGPKHDIHPGKEGVDGITGCLVADGVEGVRKAVRQQVGAGADWIKVYADYRIRSRIGRAAPATAASTIPMWTREELEELTDTAHALGVKVAAHVSTYEALKLLYPSEPRGQMLVDSIEHGYQMTSPRNEDDQFLVRLRHSGTLDISHSRGTEPSPTSTSDEVFKMLADAGTHWSPTLATYETIGGEEWAQAARTFKGALAFNKAAEASAQLVSSVPSNVIRFACGGDTGVFPHGENMREMACMVDLGADPLEVLRWSTLNGWRCVRGLGWEICGSEREFDSQRLRGLHKRMSEGIRGKSDRLERVALGDNDVPFGALRKGFAADIIALGGCPGELEGGRFRQAVSRDNVEFVLKAGRVVYVSRSGLPKHGAD